MYFFVKELYDVGNNKSAKKRVLAEVALVAEILQQYHSNPVWEATVMWIVMASTLTWYI